MVPASILSSREGKGPKDSGAPSGTKHLHKSSSCHTSSAGNDLPSAGAVSLDPVVQKYIVPEADAVVVVGSAGAMYNAAAGGISRRTSRASSQHHQHQDLDRRTTDGGPIIALELGTPITSPEIVVDGQWPRADSVGCGVDGKERVTDAGQGVVEPSAQPISDAGKEGTPADPGVWQGLKILFSDVYVLSFMFLAFLMGVGNGFIGYLFLLLDELHAPGTLLGLCLTLNTVGEVPVFYFSGALIKRLGVNKALNISMGAYVVRLGCYAVSKVCFANH